jgi:uncharacterized membrane protein YeaQ/YmgE (transglycosylase-associated protein family)
MSNVIWFIIIGIIAGWLAGTFMKGSGFGLLGDLVLGVIGAVVGGFVLGLLGFTATGLLGQLITATIGAVLFIGVLHVIKRA